MGTTIFNYLTQIASTPSSLIPWKRDPTCSFCKLLNLKTTLTTLKSLSIPRNKHGVHVAALPCRPDPLSTCHSCQLLSQVTLDPTTTTTTRDSHHHSPSGYEIRAFPFLTTELLNRFQGGEGGGGEGGEHSAAGLTGLFDNTAFLVVIPVGFSNKTWEAGNQQRIRDLVSETGYLLIQEEVGNYDPYTTQLITPRRISPLFDPDVVNTWLECCHLDHAQCSRSVKPISNLRLIDCRASVITCFDGNHMIKPPPYVSLSYVWGKPASRNKRGEAEMTSGLKLPPALPRVIEDAMQITKTIGFQYLWVDRYCIDHTDPVKKHQQIHQMDLVYQNSSLTIIAAGGEGEDWRLPGVVFGREWALMNEQQPSSAILGGGRFRLSLIPPCPNNTIRESHWATRGWTYQEAFLSRRRLVFTSDQLYFECNSMHCNESLAINFPRLYSSATDDRILLLRKFIQPREFGMTQLSSSPCSIAIRQPSKSTPTAAILSLSPTPSSIFPFDHHHPSNINSNSTNHCTHLFFQYLFCVSQYTTRYLTFSRDSLNAFSGIISQFESLSPYPVRHMWGLPFFHHSDFSSPSTHTPPLEYRGSELFFLASMCWHHQPSFSPSFPSSPTPQRHQRRPHFPSWTWAGWAGQAVWPEGWTTEWLASPAGRGGGMTSFRPTARNIRIKLNCLAGSRSRCHRNSSSSNSKRRASREECHSQQLGDENNDDDIYSLECLDYKATAMRNQRIRHPDALIFDSYAIPASAYVYEAHVDSGDSCCSEVEEEEDEKEKRNDDGMGRLSVWGCEVALAMSPRIKTSKVCRYLRGGLYEAVELGSSGGNAYFLVVRVAAETGTQGDCRRIGGVMIEAEKEKIKTDMRGEWSQGGGGSGGSGGEGGCGASIDPATGAIKCTRVGLMIMSIFQPTLSSPGSALSVGLEGDAVRSYMLQ